MQPTPLLGGLFQSEPSRWRRTEEHRCLPLCVFKSSLLVNYYYFLKNTCLGAPVLVAASGILSCGMQDLVPWPGINTGPPHLECGVWVTGPPDKSHLFSFKSCFPPLFPLELFLFGSSLQVWGLYLQCKLSGAGKLSQGSRGRGGLSCPCSAWDLAPWPRTEHVPWTGKWVLNRWTSREVLPQNP